MPVQPPVPSLARRHAGFALLLAPLLLGACAGRDDTPPPATGMEAVLQEWERMQVRRIEDLDPARARREPHLIDAARAVRNVRGLPYPQEDVPRVQDIEVPFGGGPISARFYAPQETRDTPAVLMFPAGGWARASLDVSDASARALAARTGAVVLLILPPLAPEARFPAAHDAAVATYAWALRGGLRSLGADPSRVVLAGEGTGGTLALSTALQARDLGLGRPDAVLLLTPVVSTEPATAPQQWNQDHYATRHEQTDPRLDPAGRAVLQGLPPVVLVLSEYDPQAPAVQQLITRLQEAGVSVRGQVYPGTVPEFFGLNAVVEQARQAQDWAAAELRPILTRPEPPPPPRRVARRQPRH